MLRFTPIANAAHAESYYAKSDGGYYLGSHELGCEWLGKGAARLGLAGRPDFEAFKRLIHGLDPHTGEQLTAKLIEDRIPGWDVTASVPKGVTTALERGDARVQAVIRWAMTQAFADMEQAATTRVRKKGQYEDRLTGNLVAYAVEHPETRPTKEDGRSDWDRHWHLVVFNLTHDSVEDQWKAVKFRPIMDLRKYFSHRFDMYLSWALTHKLGYELETRFKTDGKGGRKYYSWDIKGIPQSVITKNSRRSAEVEQAEKEAIQAIKERDPDAPDQLSPIARDKLGATSRLHKQDETLEELREYWNSRITPEEGRAIAGTIERARQGRNPKPTNTVDKAAAFAMEHWFYRHSVLKEKFKHITGMHITAMERCMGAALPEELEREFQKQGVISDRETLSIWNPDKEITSTANYQQERQMTGFAREGRGKERPVVPHPVDLRQLIGVPGGKEAAIQLTDEQEKAICALVRSRDVVNVVDAGQGTGKTTMLEQYGRILARFEVGTTWLGTTHTAVRELEKRGLPAMTVASLLNSQEEQQQAAGHRIIVDESSLLPHRDAYRLMMYAKEHGCRIDFVGDSKQYKSPTAGDTMRLLAGRFTGIEPITMKKTMRQQGRLKEAMEAIREGQVLKGHDMLRELGCVRELPLDQLTQTAADLYLQWSATGEHVPVISPTHAQADDIALKIRQGLRERGDLKGEEHSIRRLVDLQWSPAQLKEAKEQGAEGVVLTRYAAYREETQTLAVGDLVRTTMGGKTKDGKHRLCNGQRYRIQGFTKAGDPILSNGWVVDKDWGGLVQRYVSTGQGSQGITEHRAIVVYGTPSLVATRQEGFYVPVSRVRKEVAVLTDSNAALREAIQRQESRKSALELMHPRPQRKTPLRQRLGKHFAYLRRLAAFARTHERSPADRQRPPQEKERGYARE